MKPKDMFTLKDAAENLGVNVNTMRYWIKRNNDDCDKGFYDFKLFDLLKQVRFLGRMSKNKASREYKQYIILDIDEFKKEYEKYINYLLDYKKRKKAEHMGWSHSAIDCYKSGMECEKCFNNEICRMVALSTPEKEPPMKKTVKKLLQKIGLPPKI